MTLSRVMPLKQNSRATSTPRPCARKKKWWHCQLETKPGVEHQGFVGAGLDGIEQATIRLRRYASSRACRTCARRAANV